jgi:opacity protein-like surface antigen
MKNTKNYIALLLLMILAATSMAQSARILRNRIGFSAGMGFANYRGDYTSQLGDFIPRPSASVGLSYRLSNRIIAQSEFCVFQLTGKEKEHFLSTQFNSNNMEWSMGITYDIFKMRKAFQHRNLISPYLGIGMAVMAFDSEINQFGRNITATQTTNKGLVLAVPVSFGLRIKAAKYLDVILEASYRKTFSDKLDNSDLNSNNLKTFQEMTSTVGDQIEHKASADGYLITQVKLVYAPSKLPKKKAKSAKGISEEVLKLMKQKSLEIASR